MAKYPVAKVSELPPGARRLVRVGSIEVGLFNVAGRIVAYRNICPHAGAPVCVGRISGTSLPSAVYDYQYGHEGCILRCPWHGWEFDLRTGTPRRSCHPFEGHPDCSASVAGFGAAGVDSDRM